MKTLLSMCLLALCTITGMSQKSIDNVFDKFADNEEVTKINFSGNFLTNILQQDDKFQNSEIDNFRLLILENGNNLSSLDRKSIISELQGSNYEELMQIRSKDAHVDFYVRDTDDYVTNLVMFVQDEEQQIILDLDGRIAYDVFDDINIDFEGSNHLKMVGKKRK